MWLVRLLPVIGFLMGLSVNTDAALSHTHICCEVGVRGSFQTADMSPTLRRRRFDNHGGLIKCWQITRCNVSGTPLQPPHSPPLVWNAARSAAVVSHAAPRPGARCFTILIQRETFSQLLLLPSLCFGADLKKKGKKKERKSMKARIDWTPSFPSPSAPFWKDNVKFNSENNSNLTFFSRAAVIYDEKTSAECEISWDGTACLPARLILLQAWNHIHLF